MSDQVTDNSVEDLRRPPHPGGAGTVVGTVAVGLWAVGVVGVLVLVAWAVEQFLVIEGLAMPWWGWPAVSVLAALLVAVPALLLALLARIEAARAVARTWLAGAALLALLGSVRAVPVQHTSVYALLLAVVATVAAVLVPRLVPAPLPRGWFTYGRPAALDLRLAAAFAAGLGALLPFLVLAALGGLADTLATALAAAAVGVLAARLLHRALWPALLHWSRARQLWLGGLSAGVLLLLIAAGVGGTGVMLLEMLVLPPLGFVLAALRHLSFDAPAGRPEGRGGRPWLRVSTLTAVAVGLAAFGPLGFVSASQAWAFLLLKEVGFWGAVAAAGSALITVLFGLGYGLALPRLRRPATAGALALVLLAAAGTAYALGAPGLHGNRLFVVMREQADLNDLAAVHDVPARRTAVYRRLVATAEHSQAGLRAELDRLHLSYTPYYLVNGVAVNGGPGVRELLSRRSDVDRVLLSPVLRPIPARAAPIGADQPSPGAPVQPNIAQIGADRVWATGVTGKGVVVGSSDTGVDGGHPALSGNFRGGDDSWYDPWNHSTAPVDHSGHGTHTTATAVGALGVGVAPGASWIGCVNLDRDFGNPAYYLDCLQFMLAPFPVGGDPLRDGRPARAADVLTNSWGCTALEGCDAAALRPAVAALTAAGIFVVVAAGNTGPRCDSITDPPAIYPGALTVAAVDGHGQLADFSSRGRPGSAKPDLAAPGVDVVSALPGGGYGPLSGTSMATPHVAGVVALLWSAIPALVGDIAATTELLRRTARPVPADRCGAAADSGAGLVDAGAAVAVAKSGS